MLEDVIGTLRKYRDALVSRMENGNQQSEEACDLCGMQADRLIPVILTNHRGAQKARICPECAWVNKNCEIAEEDPGTNPGAEIETRTKVFLLKETEAGKDARIRTLAQRRSAGSPVQEDLFLEDLAQEKSVQDICSLWESYEFDRLYPDLDASLALLAEKEKRIGAPAVVIRQLRMELRFLLASEGPENFLSL